MPLLELALARIDGVRLLIVDPIASAVAGDSHKNTEVRRGLQPLADLAERMRCALLGITHYTKGTGGRDPLERVTGSLAFGALARIVLGTAKPTEEGALRRLVRAKSNIGPDGGGFEFDLEHVVLDGRPGLSATRVIWHAAVVGTARDLLAEVETEPEPAHPARAAAEEFLAAVLADGPRFVMELEAEARQAGHFGPPCAGPRTSCASSPGRSPGRSRARAAGGCGRSTRSPIYGRPTKALTEGAHTKTMSILSALSAFGAFGPPHFVPRGGFER